SREPRGPARQGGRCHEGHAHEGRVRGQRAAVEGRSHGRRAARQERAGRGLTAALPSTEHPNAKEATMAKLTTDELIEGFKELSLIELSEFVKKFEEVFEVTAAAPVAVAAAGGGAAAPVEEVEEKD